MDKAKLRMAAGGVAAILGIVSVGVLSVAGVLALELQLGLVWATTAVGGVMFLCALASLFYLAQPETSTEDEMAKIENMTAETFADLPFDAVKAMIEKHPLTSVVLAATTGYALSRNPEAALSNLRRVVTGLI